MRYYSTRNRKANFCFADASLASYDLKGGVYLPESIPQYSDTVRNSLGSMSFQDIAFETVKLFTEDEIPDQILEKIILSSYSFPTPLLHIGDRLVLELFHGPTGSLKDFGARFMANLFGHLQSGERKSIRILAVEGNTFDALTDAFYDVEGVKVILLCPKSEISRLHKSSLCKNIFAVVVEGTLDDCKKLAQAAFSNTSVRKNLILSSGSSVNIARIIAQIAYYSAAAGKAFEGKLDSPEPATPKGAKFVPFNGKTGAFRLIAGKPLSVCVPSGNFGNYVSALYAMKMGAPIKRVIAATNSNKSIPDYIESSYFEGSFQEDTISNAMDVGIPNNFERIIKHWSFKETQSMSVGVHVTDDETRETIAYVHKEFGYFIDPHTAVGWRAVDKLAEQSKIKAEPLAVLATGHPAKSAKIVEPLTGHVPAIPVIKKPPVTVQKPQAKLIKADISALLEALK